MFFQLLQIQKKNLHELLLKRYVICVAKIYLIDEQ